MLLKKKECELRKNVRTTCTLSTFDKEATRCKVLIVRINNKSHDNSVMNTKYKEKVSSNGEIGKSI